MNERFILQTVIKFADFQRKSEEIHTEMFKLLGMRIHTLEKSIDIVGKAASASEPPDKESMAKLVGKFLEDSVKSHQRFDKEYKRLIAIRESGHEFQQAHLQHLNDLLSGPGKDRE